MMPVGQLRRFLRAGLGVAVGLSLASACATPKANTPSASRIPPDEPWRSTRPAAGPMPEFTLPRIAEAELKNGLRIMVVEERSIPAVVFGFVSRAGSAHEAAKESGLARLAWETVDEGAGAMSDMELANAFGNLGTRLELTPGTEAGVLRVALLKKHLEAGVELLSTVVRKPTFAPAALDRVRAQILDDLKAREGDPDALADVVARTLMYGADHPYGRDVSSNGLTKINAARVKKFWNESVGPRNSALIFTGDISIDEATALAEKHFGKWSGGPKAIKAPSDSKPRGGFKIAFVDVPGAQQTVVRLGRPVMARGDPDEAGLMVFDAIMGGQFSSRLNLKLREEKQWTYGCFTGAQLNHGKGTWGVVSCAVQTAFTADAIVEILALLEPVAASTIAEDEITRAKQGWLKSLQGILGLPAVQLDTAARLFAHGRPGDHYATLATAASQVDAAVIQKVAERVLVKDDMVLVLVGDRSVVEPLLEQKGFTGITTVNTKGVLQKSASAP